MKNESKPNQFVLRRFMVHAKLQEGDVTHGYADKGMRVTAGPGFLADSVEAFQQFPFVRKSDGKPASPDEIAAEYQRIIVHGKKNSDSNDLVEIHGSRFKEVTELTLTKEYIDAELERRATDAMNKARSAVGNEGWNKLNDDQKLALSDITYNVGSIASWHGLIGAVNAPGGPDIERMVQESIFYTNKKAKSRNMERLYANAKFLSGWSVEDSKAAIDKAVGKQRAHQNDPESDTSEPTTTQPPATEQPEAAPDKSTGGLANEAEAIAKEDAATALLARVQNDPMESDDDLLLKRPEQLTQAEADKLWHASMKYPDGDDRNHAFAAARSKFFDSVYGTGNADYDATGRMMRPEAKRAVPTTASAPKDPFGGDVKDAVVRTAKHVTKNTNAVGINKTVQALQTGLNLVSRNQAATQKKRPAQPLKIDGDFGPKTHGQLKKTIGQSGTAKAREAVALGKYKQLVETTKTNPEQAKAFGRDVAQEFSDLYPASPVRKKAVPQVQALQESLNTLGQQEPSFTPLKEDGVLGPKTEQTFTTLAKKRDPDDMAEEFGRGLSLLG